jgi:hypothetical protein
MLMGTFLKADSGFLYMLSPNLKFAHLIDQWANMIGQSNQVLPKLLRSVNEKNLFSHLRLKDAPLRHYDRIFLTKSVDDSLSACLDETGSYLIYPVRIKEKLIGFYGFASYYTDLSLTNEQLPVLQLYSDRLKWLYSIVKKSKARAVKASKQNGYSLSQNFLRVAG